MQTLELNGERSTREKGFWRRQFQKESTESQRKFDWIFGVILPIVCFVVDPIVFKGTTFGTAWLGTFKPFAYVLSFVSVMVTSAWLIWGKKLKGFNAVLAGLFAVGGLISLGIGIVLLPFSLLGLFVIIGILGFTPLFTSIVYLRNAVRTYKTAKPFLENKLLINSFILSAVLSFAFPAILNLNVEKSLDEIKNGNIKTIQYSAQRLRFIAPLVDFDVLAEEFASEKNRLNNERRDVLAEAYQQLTGENIESRANRLSD